MSENPKSAYAIEQERLQAARLRENQQMGARISPAVPAKTPAAPAAPVLNPKQLRVKNVVEGLERLLIDAQLGSEVKRKYGEALVELRLALREVGCAVDDPPAVLSKP
jgi:hypothetical protein